MPEETKRRLAVAGKIEAEVNRYYARVAKRYTAAGVVCLALFLVTICAIFVFGSDYITTENLSYLAR
ncbi:MAG: hypothetical protein II779_11110, partial [Clostridia bacterium]|nr:hypothetical protein [Clostridia bacterium]